ncbi:hypothetical protein [Rhizohabitans arisaemae]|uniref:hypothetical protein n=1 Tax=Rhizohabitans arisaemae TaxID=2720610 RepID=UPI0024B051E1|nr:hypothetical protein [Rhizohabitans arisaemae]
MKTIEANFMLGLLPVRGGDVPHVSGDLGSPRGIGDLVVSASAPAYPLGKLPEPETARISGAVRLGSVLPINDAQQAMHAAMRGTWGPQPWRLPVSR